MRRAVIALLAAGLTIAGCSSSSGSTNGPSPAQKLADLDGGDRPTSQYQMALNAWASRCEESPSKLAGYVYATVDDLQKNGVKDETEYSALVHLKDATPAGAQTKCEDVAAGYLTLRESGGSAG